MAVMSPLIKFIIFAVLFSPSVSFALTTISSLPHTASIAGETYELSGDLSSTGHGIYITASNVTIDLKGHTLTFGTDNGEGLYGIYTSFNRSGITIYSSVAGGEIVHGATGNPAGCHGIYLEETSTSPTIHDIRIEVNSQADETRQSAGVLSKRTRNPVFYNLNIENNASAVANRHSIPASGIAAELDTSTITSAGEIYNNSIYSTHQGIRTSGPSASLTSDPAVKIYGNTVEINQVAANAYAILARANSGADDVSIYDNVITTTGNGGRGILVEHGDNFHVYDNIITVGEAETAESVWSNGIRIRYGATNSTIESNAITLLCGQLGYSGGTAIKGTAVANLDLSNPLDINNKIINNQITVNNDSNDYTCAGLHVIGLDVGHNWEISSNTVISNDIAVYLESSSSLPVHDAVFRNTRIVKETPAPNVVFYSYFFQMYQDGAVIDSEFQCSSYEGGAKETDVRVDNTLSGPLDYVFNCPGRRYAVRVSTGD